VFAGLQAGSAELRRIDHIGTDAGRAVHVIGAAFFLVSALRLQAPSGFSSGCGGEPSPLALTRLTVMSRCLAKPCTILSRSSRLLGHGAYY